MTNPYASPQVQTPASDERPTSVRYLIVGLGFLMSVLLYVDRFAIAPIATTIIRDLNLDDERFGRAVGLFFFAYALFQVPAGWLSDSWGARWTLALYMLGWSIATVGLGMAGGLIAISAMRIVLGITQAGAYPAAASLLKRWVPPGGRARANNIVSMGGRGGNLLAQFLTPILALSAGQLLGWESGGWRVVLGLYGALGLAWAAMFVWLYRDSPTIHPWCNAAERELIGHTATPTPQALTRASQPFLLAALTSPNLCLISAMGIAVNIGWVFLVTWLPRYLVARHGSALATFVDSPEVLAGTLTALTGLGGMIGSITGGAAADYFVAARGLKWGRRMPGLVAGFIVCALYLIAMRLTNVWVVVALMFAISFTIDFGLGASWASYQDIGGRQVATVLAIGNMFGNLGAAGFGWYIGALAKSDNWSAVFLIASLAMALYGTGWLFFDATRPVVREG
jgi:ACS family glucarate transporter-like MFS transporter